jgi:membrane-associated phospholipid phosphatase
MSLILEKKRTLKIIDFHKVWTRSSLWFTDHQSVAKLTILSIGLVLFIVLLPAYMRFVFWYGLKSNKILASMLLIFNFLAISLVWSAGQQLDVRVFLMLNLRGKRPAWLDRLMTGFTQIGSGYGALGISLILILVNIRLVTYEFVLGSILLWLVVESMKFLVHRSRPFIRLEQARVVGGRAIGQSFPSGHTSQAFFTATLLTQHFHFNPWVAVWLYTIAVLVGITRIYVGAHYPRDVLAGAILGIFWGLFGMIIEGNFLSTVG